MLTPREMLSDRLIDRLIVRSVAHPPPLQEVAVTSPPEHLVLTLKRFSYDHKTGRRAKILTPVHYPLSFSLPVLDHHALVRGDPPLPPPSFHPFISLFFRPFFMGGVGWGGGH